MAELKLKILYDAGHYGNFLRTFLEKFSSLTPELPGDAFTEDGRSHGYYDINWSGLFDRKHFNKVEKIDTRQNLCVVRPVTKFGFLFHKTLAFHRACAKYRKDFPDFSIDDLWKKKELSNSPLSQMVSDIREYYCIDQNDKIEKYLVRDWFKQEWLSNETYDKKFFDEIEKKLMGDTTFIFPLECMTSFESFINIMRDMNSRFGLALDFDRLSEMQHLFEKGYDMDKERHNIKKVVSVCDKLNENIDAPIDQLNVVHESFIQAEVEKNNIDFIFPMHNKFYKTTGEIIRLIKYFPNYYKIKNPHIKGGDVA